MQQLDLLLGQFLSGRSFYAPVRRALNMLFTISLTSYLYIQVHGPYRIYQLDERDEIIAFFTSGFFFIPFSFFIITYYVTQWVPAFIFDFGAYVVRVLIARKLSRKNFSKRWIRRWINRIVLNSKYTPRRFSRAELERVLLELRTHVTSTQLSQMRESFKAPLKQAEANFILFSRTVVAITVYFNVLPQFGWKLYVLVLGVLVFAMSILVVGVVVLHVLPEVITTMLKAIDTIQSAQNGESSVHTQSLAVSSVKQLSAFDSLKP
jgi:hypothetical protein